MRKKILIVEDNPDLQMIYQTYFEKAGFHVMVSGDGLACLTDVASFQPDVLLLDIMMPEMNGFEVLASIRHNFNSQEITNLPIIVCSNLTQEADIAKATDVGADLYIQKSDYEGAEIVQKVLDYLKENNVM